MNATDPKAAAAKRTIMVVDDMAIFRDPIAASLRLAGYQTIVAADGEEALRQARANRPDLILLDLSMPKMDGLTVLGHLRADPDLADVHVILLTAISERKHVVTAGSLGIKDYLLKSRFKLPELLERIERRLSPAPAAVDPQAAAAVVDAPPKTVDATKPVARAATSVEAARPAAASAPASLPQLLSREACVRRAEGAMKGKTLSGVVTQVITLANSPRADTNELGALIARDSMLAVRVLQAANSAAYASRGGMVATIPNAIRKVGCSAVRNIAAALGIFDMMPETSGDGFNPIHCWVHSFAVAQLCERIAKLKHADSAGVAYVVGLCHDLGEILARAHFAPEYQQVADATARTGRPRDDVQREMIGLTHRELLAVMLKFIGLPDSIRKPIEAFHVRHPDRATDPLARILWLAENYANGLMLASGSSARIAPLMQAACLATTDAANPARPESDALRTEVLGMTAMLARLSKSDEARIMSPMFEAADVGVWLARDASISTFDPIHTALDALSRRVDVHDRLPTPAEAAEVDAIVVLSSGENALGFAAADVERAAAACRASSGKPVPMLTLERAAKPTGNASARTEIELAELAAFVRSAAVAAPIAVAA